MTDTPEKTDNTDKPSTPSSAAPSKRAKWRRRIIFLIALAFVLSLAFRLLVTLLFPVVLNKVAAGYGFSAKYDRMDLYFLGGDIGLFNLRFAPVEGGDSVLDAKYVRGSISVLQLLRGRLRVERAEAEETTLSVDRLADGSVPLLDRVLKNLSTAPSKPSNVQLEPPLMIDTFRLQNIKVKLHDQSVNPGFSTELFMNMMVSGLGDNRIPINFDMQLFADNLLGVLNVRGTATTDNNRLTADVKVNLNDFRPDAIAGYLQQFGMAPGSQSIDAFGTGRVYLQPTTWPPVANVDPKNPPLTNAITGTINLDHILATADALPFAKLDTLAIKIKALTPSEIRLNQIALDGVHAAAGRSEEGYVQLAGLQVGSSGPTTRRSVTRPTTTPVVANATTGSMKLPILEIEDFHLTNVDLSATDRALTKPVTASMLVKNFNIAHFSTDAASTQPTAINIAGNAPGIARQFTITGKAEPAAQNKTLQLAVRVEGINPNAVGPYLQALGLRHDLHDATFACDVRGLAQVNEKDIAGNVTLSGVSLVDEGKELFSLPTVALGDFSIAQDMSLIRLGKIDIGAPHLLAGRAEDGSFYAFGLHTTERLAPRSRPVPATSPAAEPIDLSTLPALEIGSLNWTGLALEFNDATVTPPRQVPITDAGVELKNILISFRNGAVPKEGTYRAYVKLPHNIDALEVNGHIKPAGTRVDFDCRATGDGIAIETFKPLLKELGIESTLKAGRVEFAGQGVLLQKDQGIASDFTVSTARFSDGQTEWAAVDSAKISGAYFDGKKLTVESFTASKPRTLVRRDKKGQLTVAGLTLLASDKPKPPSTQPIVPSRIDLTLPLAAKLNQCKIDDATLLLTDESTSTPVSLRGRASVEAQNLSIGDGAVPAKVAVFADLHGVCESFRAEGTVLTAPHQQSMKFNVQADKVTGAALRPYLPPGMELSLREGQFKTQVEASFADNPAGGSSGLLKVDQINWSDAGSPMAHVDQALVDIARFDLDAKRVDLKSITVKGATLTAGENERGPYALGLQIVPSTQPVAKATLAAPTTQAVASVDTLMAAAKQTAPLITLQSLDLRADKVSLVSHRIARPLTMSNLQLVNTNPIELFGEDPSARAPFGLNVFGKVDDVIGQIKIESKLAPCATEPTASADVSLADIRGDALTQFFPKLADKLDGSDLNDGKLTAHLQSTFQYTRRGMLGIDLTRDIGAEFQVQRVSLTSPKISEPLAGVQEVHGERIKFSPGTGNLSVGNLEITKPSARMWRDTAGIHGLGLMFKMPTVPSTQPTTAPAVAPTETAAAPAAPEAPVATAAPAEDVPEYRVDQLVISGLDFEFVDRTGQVETHLPLNDLDVQVQGFTTKMFREAKPVRFSAVVGAGKVDLPTHLKSSDADSLRAASTQPVTNTEPRDLFAQATATGNFIVFPQPQGWSKLSVSSFELSSLRGFSQPYGVNLAGGTMDALVDFKMNGTEDITVKPRLTFTDLSMSETDGRLARILSLPGSVDAAIKLVQKPDGTISFPLEVQMKKQSFSIPQVLGSVVGAMGKVMGDAVLSAPMKLVAAPVNLVGIDTGSWFKKKTPDSLTVTFPNGESQLTEDQIEQLRTLADAMQGDDSIAITIKPVLGQSDAAVLSGRANPNLATCRTLVARLRAEKAALQQQIATQRAEMRAVIASGNRTESDRLQGDLVASLRQLGETELSLDDLLGMLRQGADKQAPKRTRTASLLVGQQRLDNVLGVMKSVKIDNFTGRSATISPTADPAESASAGTVEVQVRRVSQ